MAFQSSSKRALCLSCSNAFLPSLINVCVPCLEPSTQDIKSAFDLQREENLVRKVHFPPRSFVCVDNLQSALRESGGTISQATFRNVTCGYPDNSLMKLTMPSSKVHEDLRRALKFLDVGFMVTQNEVDTLMKLYMPRLLQVSSPLLHDCNRSVAEHAVFIWSKLVEMFGDEGK